ncbi:MAG: tRNA (adenosine(37)-N6)-threonylcarbamoyltransferase complex transferase subunit TsaD [Candidatus Margulisbacteria bacterium]|nr:tRNA (adenosine(37)-N6)-threonylcarbamoyltransferase complex transferase subunit TsaD [Candidatus Margulisiibacteriota bacterium]
MIILAIETSCDETACAIVQDGTTLLGHTLLSQMSTHNRYGGVVPELASRMHTESIHTVIYKTLQKSALSFQDINAIAVTQGPGLEGALLVGMAAAKTMAVSLNIPLISVNHLHGHIYSVFLTQKPRLPFIALLISGGHTQLILVKKHFHFELLGQTRDDAVGEAFDKIARYLKLGYPGGPVIEETAKNGDPTAFKFPRAMKHDGLDFSFSGLKTAVIQQIMALEESKKTIPIADICASFQQAVIDILIHKSLKAARSHHIERVLVTGGVSANQTLISEMTHAFKEKGLRLYSPPLEYCTDNAAMIGIAAHFQMKHQKEWSYRASVKPGLGICDLIRR